MASLLHLDSVSKSYMRGPRELRVLRENSLDVHEGELVAVYGKRGAGKTTLLRVAAGFEPPTSGVVTFDGIDLSRVSRSRRARLHRSEIGWVERAGPSSQELVMREYVALPLYRSGGPAQAERRAMSALAKVGAEDVADARWANLSDTERTLVAIAEALVRKPRLLLIDDPTAMLGMADRERVTGMLCSAAEDDGLGVLMAVPEMPAMLQAHKLRALSRGRLLTPSDPPPGLGEVIDFPRGERSA